MISIIAAATIKFLVDFNSARNVYILPIRGEGISHFYPF